MSFPFQTEADAWFARLSPMLGADEDDPGMGAFLARNERDLVELLRLKLEKDATAALLAGMRPASPPIPLRNQQRSFVPPPPQAYTKPTPAVRWPRLNTTPPGTEGGYIDANEPTKWLRQHYLPGGDVVVKSSRETPAGAFPWKVGTWQIASWPLGYGRWIEQLREVDPADLLISEETTADRLADVDTYAAWMKAGKVAPPVSVSTMDDGRLKITGDGHRRRLAAIKAGVKLLAWVGDAVLSGQLAAHGTPMYTLLTFELVNPAAAAEFPSLRYERIRNIWRARAAWRLASNDRPPPPMPADLERAKALVLKSLEGLAKDGRDLKSPDVLRRAITRAIVAHAKEARGGSDGGLWAAFEYLQNDTSADEDEAMVAEFQEALRAPPAALLPGMLIEAIPPAPSHGRSVWTSETAQKAEADLARAKAMVLASMAGDSLLRATQKNTPHNLRQGLETVVRRHVRNLISAARDDLGLWTALVRLGSDDEVKVLAEAFIQQHGPAPAAPQFAEEAPPPRDVVHYRTNKPAGTLGYTLCKTRSAVAGTKDKAAVTCKRCRARLDRHVPLTVGAGL